MADKLVIKLVEDEPPFGDPPYSGLMPPDELAWWQKQLGKPLEASELEPALH